MYTRHANSMYTDDITGTLASQINLGSMRLTCLAHIQGAKSKNVNENLICVIQCRVTPKCSFCFFLHLAWKLVLYMRKRYDIYTDNGRQCDQSESCDVMSTVHSCHSCHQCTCHAWVNKNSLVGYVWWILHVREHF